MGRGDEAGSYFAKIGELNLLEEGYRVCASSTNFLNGMFPVQVGGELPYSQAAATADHH
jgi:hypothetical protein